MAELRNWTDAELDKLAEEMVANYERMMAATEAEVIGCMVENGCPRKDAEQQLKIPGLATFARQFYIDAQDAILGDPVAKDRVERCRAVWGEMTERREAQK